MTTETTTAAQHAENEKLWAEILKVGGRRSYIDKELQRTNALVVRKSVDGMSKRDLNKYKQSLRNEAVVRRDLLKKTWLAYKAHHILHLGEGVFWSEDWDWDKYDHPLAEERQAENDVPRIDKPAQLAELLKLKMHELRALTFHRDAARVLSYTRFTIPKSDGGERAIWAPSPTLKAAQRWILQEIVERLPVHGAAHGFLSGRSILTNAALHTDARVVVKMDLKDFFPTVTWKRVKGVFRKAGYREQIATLLALLCTEAPREVVEHNGQTYYIALGQRCLPQGAPTSPALTNALCLRLDRRITGLCNKLGWRYTRYADDLTFSLPADFKGDELINKLLGGVRAIVEDEGFVVHPDKTRVMRPSNTQRVTGLVVNGPGTPRVPREIRRSIRTAIHLLHKPDAAFADGPTRDEKLMQLLGSVGRAGTPDADQTLRRVIGYASYIYMTDRELGAKYLESLSTLA
jgi:RNA-directed DNA polymerase